jgi:fatty acid/phospholipid biosynthesis enzyme
MGPAAPLFYVFTAATAIASYTSQERQADAQSTLMEAKRKEMDTNQRIADIKARRERLNTIRKSRMARMKMEASAARGGALDSSAFAGASGSLVSQTRSSIGTAGVISNLAREQSIFNRQASQSAQSSMDSASTWAGLQTIFSAGSSIESSRIP